MHTRRDSSNILWITSSESVCPKSINNLPIPLHVFYSMFKYANIGYTREKEIRSGNRGLPGKEKIIKLIGDKTD